jgi:hypothetical protein
MKTPRPVTLVLSLSAMVALSVATVNSAPVDKTPAAAPKAAAAEPEPAIPQSVFTIPSTSGVARDPFFPSRIIQAQVAKPTTTTNAAPRSVSLSCLVLKGLSGTAANPLAMVNGRTMARGESAEIVTDCGRLLVHCVDITANSAIVEVGGERRELRLRSDL